VSGNLKSSYLDKWVKTGVALAGKSDGGGLTFTVSRAGTATWFFATGTAAGRGR